jgi:hypothetical protein
MSDRRPEPTVGGVPVELIHERASATPSRGAITPGQARAVATSLPVAAHDVPLRTAQSWFARAITHAGRLEDGVVEAARAHLGLAEAPPLESLVTAGPALGAIDRLGIYHYAYRARLIECLADDYPAVLDAIGGDAFDSLCRDYITAHPSTSPNLVGFGKHFAAFCRGRTEAWGAFAAELATLEWGMTEVIHAPEAPALALEELQKIPPEEWAAARFTPARTLRVFHFSYPTNAYFQAFRDGAPRAIPEPAPSATAVYRQGFTIWRMDLTPAMAGLLDALCDGAKLGHALEALESHVVSPDDLAEAERNVIAWFSAWVSGGFFSKLTFDE